MIYFLFIILLISGIASFIIKGKNILSVCVLGHLVYLLSTFFLVLSYDRLEYDISLYTVFIIEGTLIFLGIGESIGKKICGGQTSYPDFASLPIIAISKKKYLLCLSVVLISSYFAFYKFNYIGRVLGGDELVSKYILVRGLLTTEDGARGIYDIVVPYDNFFSYLSFLSSAVFYTCIFVYFYMLFYKNQHDNRLLLVIWAFIPCLLFSTSRSIFINVISISLVIISLIFIQSHKGLSKNFINKKIIKWGLCSILSFGVIFLLVGSLKEQDVISDFTTTMTSYAGASIIGLDKYVKGEIHIENDYPGQVTLEGLISFLNHFGFDHKLATYHQENFYYGNNVSNIFSAPYYMMRDFPLFVVFFIHLLWGTIISYYFSRIKKNKVLAYMPIVYIVVGYLYYPIFMISITDAFRHLIGVPFVYTIISILLVQRFIVNKSLKI